MDVTKCEGNVLKVSFNATLLSEEVLFEGKDLNVIVDHYSYNDDEDYLIPWEYLPDSPFETRTYAETVKLVRKTYLYEDGKTEYEEDLIFVNGKPYEETVGNIAEFWLAESEPNLIIRGIVEYS